MYTHIYFAFRGFQKKKNFTIKYNLNARNSVHPVGKYSEEIAILKLTI